MPPNSLQPFQPTRGIAPCIADGDDNNFLGQAKENHNVREVVQSASTHIKPARVVFQTWKKKWGASNPIHRVFKFGKEPVPQPRVLVVIPQGSLGGIQLGHGEDSNLHDVALRAR